MLVALLLLDVVLDGLATGAHGVPGVQNLDHHVAAVDHLTQANNIKFDVGFVVKNVVIKHLLTSVFRVFNCKYLKLHRKNLMSTFCQ